MKKKNVFALIIAIIIVIIAIALVIYLIVTTLDAKDALTLSEKQWIENNKNKVLDFGMVNGVVVMNHTGSGIIYDFFKEFESLTGLELNKTSYEYGEAINEKYSFAQVHKVDEKDILVYSDNYAIISKNRESFNSIAEIENSNIGVLEEYKSEVSFYLVSNNIQYEIYEDYDAMLEEFTNAESKVDYIIMPKLLYLSKADVYKDLYISYNITEVEDYYVIKLGDDEVLNSILKKNYNKWEKENFIIEYNKYFTDTYFELNYFDEQLKAKFKSKRYVYGFLDNEPFDLEVKDKLVGINSAVLASFSDLADIEISFKKYSDVDSLIKAFNDNKIDLYFNRYNRTNFNVDTFDSVAYYDEKIAVISNFENDVIINSISSLRGVEVITLGNTKIEEELKKIGVKVKTYNSFSELFKNIKEKDIIVIDLTSYNYFNKNSLSNYKINTTFSLDENYSYKIRNVSNNYILESFFDYYLRFTDTKNPVHSGQYDLIKLDQKSVLFNKLIFGSVSLIILITTFILGSRIMPKKEKNKISMKKEDKLRYIDMLTSLKNRNYLNDNIEIWDNSEVYPQGIIILDLNNVAYINDNYGHQEGDNVIKEAANILITNQIENSDIIRTNGNEFLIYLVGYDEKQVIAYTRKLSKEFKELTHGFGAAVGYSIINDGIKTIDDAVNEATLDMRNNKEETNN